MKSYRLQAHLEAAKSYAKLSKAKRLQVGALIIDDDRPIVVGINGMPSGGSNICETNVRDKDNITLTTKREVSHAEFNAIGRAAKKGIPTDKCILILTHSPCFDCAKLILAAGIKEVYYETEYRDISGIEFLNKYIKCKKIVNSRNIKGE